MPEKLAVILGSGIKLDSNLADDLRVIYNDDGTGVHKKKIFSCRIDGHELLVIQGRKHFYEGYDETAITENINFALKYGAENLLITNAAGGVNDNFNIGDLMLIRSHVNLNTAFFHKQRSFPYDAELSQLFSLACCNAGVILHEGVYGYYQGPTYETKAEVRFQRKFRIDAAGMSTVPEVNRAIENELRVAGVSVITNLLKEDLTSPATHDEVLAEAEAASAGFNKALIRFIEML
jgi:purine-nucleoside phosphorylase